MTDTTIITLDLDDTLIPSMEDFTHAINKTSSYISHVTNTEEKQVRETGTNIDTELIQTHLLSIDRLTRSYHLTLEKYHPNTPTKEQYQQVTQLTHEAYRTRKEYRERGFNPGAKALLQKLNQDPRIKQLWLITSGDNRLQKRKIKALQLHEYFDNIEIPSTPDGKQWVLEQCSNSTNTPLENITHIGNSLHSDIQAAINAGTNTVFLQQESQWMQSDPIHEYTEQNQQQLVIADTVLHLNKEYETLLEIITPPYNNTATQQLPGTRIQ